MVRAATLGVLLAGLGFAAAGCGGAGAGSAAGTTTNSTTPTGSNRAADFQVFQTCLKSKGITLPARPFRRGNRPRTFTAPTATTPRTPGSPPRGGFFGRNLTPAQQKAFQACRSKLPSGGRFRTGPRPGSNNPEFAKYTQCLAKHGVKFGLRGNRTTFAKAQAACRSLLPAPTSSSG